MTVGGKPAAVCGKAAMVAVLLTLAANAAHLPTAAVAHHPASADLVSAAPTAAPSTCPGSSITPDRVVTGEFGTDRQGSYVMLPFTVPAGQTAVRVKYCHDQPEAPTNARLRHTLDIGLYEARPSAGDLWGEDEFRGWGGSSHPDVTVSREGFSTEAQYLADPRGHVPGKTTRGFLPGPVPAGEWAVELGVAAVVSQSQGDLDGKVSWRVEIDWADDPAFANEPYQPAPYDTTAANPNPGWYAGDFHVHAEHSSLGDATMTETFDYAFRPLDQGGAGLDFITLSDYVTRSAWGEVGRHQAGHAGKLIARSAEVITYRGHANNHASVTFVDYRTGPVYERSSDGTLVPKRGARPASEIFEDVHAAGGFTQINHPTIFTSQVPPFALICRGCSWDYSDTETDYTKVDAIEISTGPPGLQQPPDPGPNPFTPLAIEFWEHALEAGNKIAAVGSSDSHNAGRTPDPITQAPIGVATTAVFADELSETGVQRGVEAGHTYVKIFGNDGPDLRFEARIPGSDRPPAIMGDTVFANSVDFTARVLGAGPSAARPGDYELFVIKDGEPLLAVPVTGDDFSFPFPSVGPGRYRLQLERGSAIEAVSSPIYLDTNAADLSVDKSDSPDPLVAGEQLTYTVTVGNGGPSGATDVRLTDVLPSGVVVNSVTPSRGSCNRTDRTVRCRLGHIPSADTAVVTIRVTPQDDGTFTNTASVTNTRHDPDDSNNTASVVTTVSSPPCPRTATRLGTDANDTLTGTNDSDRIRGLRGDDVIRGLLGNDCLVGQWGRDTLRGDAGKDRLEGGLDGDFLAGGSGVDKFFGGGGDDRIFAADGVAETVDCGPGADTVSADATDTLVACESVSAGF
jgi:uncharacterized repeat protein (TIGR01451 family)